MAQIPDLAQPTFLFACQEGNNDVVFYSSPQPQNLAENEPPLPTNEVMHLPLDSYVDLCFIRGFVCFIYKRPVNGGTEYLQMICNPRTRVLSILPNLPNRRRVRMMSYYGYHEDDNQLKVLSMTWQNGRNFDEHHVLTFGDRNEWRNIDCNVPHYATKTGICIKSVLYYPAIDRSTGDENMLVCFDVSTEVFSSVPVNTEALIEALEFGTLIDYSGYLAILEPHGSIRTYVVKNSTSFTLWKLNQETNQWSSHKYEFPPLLEMVGVLGEAMLSFVGITQTSEVVLSSFGQNNQFYLFYYNLETNAFRRVQIQGMDEYVRRKTFLN